MSKKTLKLDISNKTFEKKLVISMVLEFLQKMLQKMQNMARIMQIQYLETWTY
jgi:hypothetical protein